MAVFMVNICKFNGCGLTFQSLGDLIWHIEDSHIDYDPLVIEQKEQQQPQCMPLSYILPFFTDAARKDHRDVKPKPIKVVVTKPSSPPTTSPTATPTATPTPTPTPSLCSSTHSVTPTDVAAARPVPQKPLSVAIIEVSSSKHKLPQKIVGVKNKCQ